MPSIIKYTKKNGEKITYILSKEKSTWLTMRYRCNTKTCPSYPNYGGRGIKICERWHDFNNFLSDMGPAPIGYSIERLNNDGDYEPGNCIWATSKQQMNNTSRNLHFVYRGVTKTLAQWCEEYCLTYSTVYMNILRLGLSHAEERLSAILDKQKIKS